MSAPATICPHNAEGQTLIPGVGVHCRMCGADIQPAPEAVSTGAVQAGAIQAVYPGGSSQEEAE